MKAIRLLTEYLKEPLGLGTRTPRFYWNCEGGVRQTAYRIIVNREGRTIWDTGKVASSRMTHIPYEGEALCSRDILCWQVTLWDENDMEGKLSEGHFEMGLLSPSDWQGEWISGDYRPKKGIRYPVDGFRKQFETKKEILRARLYATARGIYSADVDGLKLADFLFAPGMTDYRKRIQYQTYDVTALLQNNSKHTLELTLADGWFRGSTAAYGVTGVYGTQTSILAQLEITYRDGTRQIIKTDNSWGWSNDGPIRFADLKDGEVIDAVMKPTYGGNVKIVKAPKDVMLCASDNVPVTAHERFAPKLLTVGDGTRVLDFGQNIAGVLEFKIKAKRGQEILITCGEILNDKGHVDLSGIQETKPEAGWTQSRLIGKLLGKPAKWAVTYTPLQQVKVLASGGEDHIRMHFSVFGFRYAQIEADADVMIEPEDFTAIAVYSDMEEVGDFSCSNEAINRLVQNTRWSMKGNFLELPTDCPTRERLGWTGDAQIFFNTGAYLMNTAPFFAKWMRDMGDAQYKNGLLPAVLPYQGAELMYKATGQSVGWADAVYLIPMRFYKMYGDVETIMQYFPMIQRYADYLMRHLGPKKKSDVKVNPDRAFIYEKGVHLGEWLEPEEFRDPVYGASARHSEEGTAYLYLAMKTIADAADFVGEKEYAGKLRQVAERTARVYVSEFVRNGAADTDRQAKLVRPLALGVLDAPEYSSDKQKMQEHLQEAVEHYHYRVGTGFLSTPFLLPALADAGFAEDAYRVLENTKRPGWLAEIEDGATTVWENWEGNLSQNHYSPGAVCEWLFSGVAGIRPDGERHFVIKPLPGGTLTEAQASWKSIYGEVKSAWEKDGDQIKYTVVIPPNTSATFILTDGTKKELYAGENHEVLPCN